MEWGNIIGIIAALAVTVGLPLALRKRKKEGPQQVEQLLYHLRELGVKASPVEGGKESAVGVRRSWSDRAEGVIRVEGGNIDYINVISVSSQYGVNYFLDYLVGSPEYAISRRRKRTRLTSKRSSGLWGKVVDIEWKGDDYLARELNFDYQLKDKLLSTELPESRAGIWIFPESKHEYVRIRTAYRLPSSDSFQVIEIVAKHIKSGW